MFRNYTQEGCIFECQLKNAFETIGCLPWDYPVPPQLEKQDTNHIRMCNSSSSTSESDLARFEDYMNSVNSTINCDCLSDCEEVSFEIQVHILLLRSH